MRRFLYAAVAAGAVALAPALAFSQDQHPANARFTPVANEQISPPPLHLTEQQREEVRQALKTVHNEFVPSSKAVKPAAGFEPKIGAKLPAQLKPSGLPQELIQKIPSLADYGYVQFKHQVLLVNEMTGEIVDLMPEA